MLTAMYRKLMNIERITGILIFVCRRYRTYGMNNENGCMEKKKEIYSDERSR